MEQIQELLEKFKNLDIEFIGYNNGIPEYSLIERPRSDEEEKEKEEE